MAEEGTRRVEPVLGIVRADDSVVIRLAGELDLYNADDVRAALTQVTSDGPSLVVVDLSEVEFVDSTALGVLIEARAKLGRTGLRLAAPRHETRRALQVSGLDRHLPVHDTVEDALAAS